MPPPIAPRRLWLWALLIPVAYAPSYLLGTRPGPVAALIALAAIALAAAALLALERGQVLDRLAARLDRAAPLLLTLAVAAYVGLAVARAHARLAAFADLNQLGLFSQSFWTLLHGHPFANTHETLDGSLGSHWAIHFSPTLLVIAPVYVMWRDPIVLMAAQALALGLVPVPVYHLLVPRVGRAAALVLALAVLAIPNILWAGPRDFRDASFLPALLLATLWALDRRRPGMFLLFGVAALGVREEIGLAFVVLGVYALLAGHRPRVALGIAALGLAWFAVVVGVVMPRFWSPGLWIDPKRFFVDVLGQWGATPVAAVRHMVTHPADVARALANGTTARYLYTLLRPLLFLPPFGDAVAIVALPGLGLNLLSRLPFMRGADQAYSMVPMTFLAAATVMTAARVAQSAPAPRRAGVALAAAIIVFAGVVPSLAVTYRQSEPPSPPAAAAAALVRAIPAGAPVYAPVTLYPALHAREDFGCWWSVLQLGRDPRFRARYAWIAIWPPGDPSVHDARGASPDQPLADSLALDPRFVARTEFAPFIVYQRR
ncbi:MAG: DUF2079 domain-containing protein [Candidatus Eisenbacteria bacterium]|nr:DUF2079 domain-containing protein [Candidatus Eisenbacteria bacterium]